MSETVKIGQRGALIIPRTLRDEYGLEEGHETILEALPEGILVKPAISVPVRRYTDREKAEFILRAALTPEDYEQALEEVRALGVDPKSIPHNPPR